MKGSFLIALLALALLLPGCAKAGAGSADQARAAVPAPGVALAETDAEDAVREIDLDLAPLSGTVVYSQIYLMMTSPEDFMGKVIRAKGNFSYYRDPNTGAEYFAAVIADATACCAQGLEFVLSGEHVYPQDYPELGTEIVVTGVFDTYEENGMEYIRLLDAEATWDE